MLIQEIISDRVRCYGSISLLSTDNFVGIEYMPDERFTVRIAEVAGFHDRVIASRASLMIFSS
jgi:hypothetical protein